jgi:sugar (pentulose or hexulose) kinase
MASTSTFIGIDLGTSGVRAIAIDDRGRELAAAKATLPASVRVPGGSSIQRPDDWWRAATAVLCSLMAQLPGRAFRCIAVDGTSATVLLCTGDGTPISPALMYDDTSGAALLALIGRIAPPDTAVHSASSSLVKLLHLLRTTVHLPKGAKLVHQADWILGKLLRRFGASDENNCLKLGYDAEERHWPEWLGALGLPPDLLPEVYPAGTVLGPIDPILAAHIGLPADCELATGTTDSTAAAIASGIAESGDAVSSLGSTLAIKVLTDRPLFDSNDGIYSHRLGARWLAGGASNSGGAVLARYFTAERIAALTRAPGFDPTRPSGLHYYPLLRPGERFPINDAGLKPELSPRPPDDARFLQGLLEGIARIERRGYERLTERGAPYPRRVVSIGGGANNDAWRRIRETELQVPVLIAQHQEAAYGAAKLAEKAYRERDPGREPDR